MRSLQLRIVAAIGLVCAVTLAAVALYVGRTTLLVRIGPPPGAAVAAASAFLPSFLRTAHSQMAMQSQLARLDEKFGVSTIIVNVGSHSALASSGPIPPGDVSSEPDGSVELTLHAPGPSQRNAMVVRGGIPIVDNGKRTPWLLFVLPAQSPPDALKPVRNSIIASIWESAALALATALTIAIVLGSYIVKPIRELTVAAQAMSKGETGRRVEIGSVDEIGALGTAFNVMAESIETTERLRRRMITDVAHELRSPLTRIILQLEAVADGHLSYDETLLGVRDEARRLERIVNDLRDLSLADAHELSIPSHPISLGNCIGDALERMKHDAAKAGVSLASDIAPSLPAALGDEFRVAQILDNLITNALRHTPAGGCVVVGARAKSNHIECFVQDNGSGIASEHLQSVFERFYRVDLSRSRTTGGSGLGLAIVKSLVEALGGTIAAESALGRGSRFTWTLPASSFGAPPTLQP